MARIKNINKYPKDSIVTGDDYVIGTDANSNNKTKNFSMDSIANYVSNFILSGNGTPIVQNNKVIEVDLTSESSGNNNVWEVVNQRGSFQVKEDEIFVFKNSYIVNGLQKSAYWLLKTGARFYGQGQLTTNQNDFFLLRLEDLITSTSDLINDGNGLDPFITESDITGITVFNSITAATAGLGVNKLFAYSEQNLDGVPSPNNSMIGVTK